MELDLPLVNQFFKINNLSARLERCECEAHDDKVVNLPPSTGTSGARGRCRGRWTRAQPPPPRRNGRTSNGTGSGGGGDGGRVTGTTSAIPQ